MSLAAAVLALLLPAAAATTASKPHIFLVLADDLGHGNVGWTRKRFNCTTDEVQTPVLDGLVEEGIELTRFYVYHMCSPTRSALQSGRHPMHVNIINADPTIYNASASTGTGAGIPRNMTTLATKLRAGGYIPHMAGKWDAGMATPTHTPLGRGYETSLGYFHHGNSYWSYETGDMTCPMGADIWDTDHPAHNVRPTAHKQNLWNLTAYEEYAFLERLLGVLEDYTPAPAAPLFLFYAAHLVHDPLDVPQQYLNRFSKVGGGPIDNSTANDNSRLSYHAMTYYLDENVGKLVNKFKLKSMWENTLMLFISDNGGPIYGAGNNYPLRGGKYSEFEGGVRVAAFVSGGAIAVSSRGTRADGIMAIADVYATFCSLAEVSPVDTLGDAAGLPPVDGIDCSPMLLGTGSSPRTEIPLEPLDPKDAAALDEYDAAIAAMAVLEGQLQNDPAFEVLLGHPCHDEGLDHYNFSGNVSNVAACEANCAADPVCQMFSHKSDTVSAKSHFCALYNKSFAPASKASGGFDCGCRGKCPTSPGPGPPGPNPPKPGRCAKLQGWDYLDANISLHPGKSMNDCCDICNQTTLCAVSVFYPDRKNHGMIEIRDRGVLLGHRRVEDSMGPMGTCVMKAGRLQPVNNQEAGSVAWLPAGVPVPPPVITEQAGLVIGDMKIIVGVSVNMAVFTGPHFPNASTPWTNNNSIKVPSFACSKPFKPGCLFNVTADPTEHTDLALEMPEVFASMLARLRNITKTRFDPNRGPGDSKACVQMRKNKGPDPESKTGPDPGFVGFFGPWLE